MLSSRKGACCLRLTKYINAVLENSFSSFGGFLFRCPLPILLLTVLFFGLLCIKTFQIQTEEDILELILGEDSLVIKTRDWQEAFIDLTNWGIDASCVEADPTPEPTVCADDPMNYLANHGGCAGMVNSNGCSFDFSGTTLAQICPLTCNEGCGALACVDDPDGSLSGGGTSCAGLAADADHGCAYNMVGYGFADGTLLSDICPVTCEIGGCGGSRRIGLQNKRRLTSENDCSPTTTPTHMSDTSQAFGGTFVFQGVDHAQKNILTPEFLMEYIHVGERFFKEWTTTCDEFPGLDFGFRDVGYWDQYNEEWNVDANFPLRIDSVTNCFREGNWTNYENEDYVLASNRGLSYLAEYALKGWSLAELANSDLTEDEKTLEIGKAIHSCWKYLPFWQARLPFYYLAGGMTFEEYSSDNPPALGDYVMVNVGGNHYEPGVIGTITNCSDDPNESLSALGGCTHMVNISGCDFDLTPYGMPGHNLSYLCPVTCQSGCYGFGNEYYTVVDSVNEATPLSTDAYVDDLRKRLSSAAAVQSTVRLGIQAEFAKRVERRLGYCEVEGHSYNCTADDRWDEILSSADSCYRHIIEGLAADLRKANSEEGFLIDAAVFTPWDDENILENVASTSAVYLIVCYSIMLVFVVIIVANPWNPAQSKMVAGGVGVILSILSTAAGLGLCLLLFNVDFTPGTMQVLPFLGVGIGVDDMLVLLYTYHYQTSKENIRLEISRAMKEAGLSVTLTTVTNFFSFVIGATMPLKELSYFSMAAACVMMTNYIGMIFGFSAVLVLDNIWRVYRWEKKNITPDLKYDSQDEEMIGSAQIKRISGQALGFLPSLVIFLMSIGFFFVTLAQGEPEWGLSLGDLIPDGHGMSSFFTYWETYFTVISADFGFGMNYENGSPTVNWNGYYRGRFQELKDFYAAMNAEELLVVTANWIGSFEAWVETDMAVSSDNVPDEDQTDLTLLGFVDSTQSPAAGDCSPDVDAPYAFCTLYAPLAHVTCLGEDMCADMGPIWCTGGDCGSCQGVINQLVIGGDANCDYPILSCPEYRFGGGKCFNDETNFNLYIGRAGTCQEPPTDPAVVQTTDEGPYYTILDENLDKLGCMDWCDSDADCIGFLYWVWPSVTGVEDPTTMQFELSSSGCRLFNSHFTEECTAVDATLTESDGVVSLWKSPKDTTDEIVCTQGPQWTNNQEYQEACFEELLRYWATKTAAKATSAKELIWSNGGSQPGEEDYLVGGESEVLLTGGALGAALSGKVSVKAIEQSREVCETYSYLGGYAIGILYEYYDQLFEVDKYLFPSIGWILLVVLFCSFLFILHPLAALIMLVSLTVTLVELWGILTWADIKVNGVLALNMVVACGVTVEFSAHINRRFMLAVGTPRERMARSLGDMFIPVTVGALTSVLAVSFMAFSDLSFIRIYYFRLFSVMIFIGWWNGVFFQSTMLMAVATALDGTCLALDTISKGDNRQVLVNLELANQEDGENIDDVTKVTLGEVSSESESPKKIKKPKGDEGSPM